MANPARPGRVAPMLKSAREANGLSVRALAGTIEKQTGGFIGPSYITDMEKGRSVPTDHIARQIASRLGIDVETFIDACQRDRKRSK